MKKKMLGYCPICDEKLMVSQLKCNECNTKIEGEFSLSKFDYLTVEQQNFALVFLKNAGNIKAIEKELNISYPTVKKNLDEVIKGLGFDEVTINYSEKLTRSDILKMLKNKEITFEEAEGMLKELGE